MPALSPQDELTKLVAENGLPEAVDPVPVWLSEFMERNGIRFADPKFILPWLKNPMKWMLGRRFELD
jgi:hypothetical protein